MFIQIESLLPEMARRYKSRARPAIVEAGAFLRAVHHLPDSLQKLGHLNRPVHTFTLFAPDRAGSRRAWQPGSRTS